MESSGHSRDRGNPEGEIAWIPDQVRDDNLYVSVRTREGKDLGQIPIADFLKQLQEYIDKKI